MLTVLGFLSSLLSLGLKLWGWLSARAQQKAGADAQAARDTAKAETVETAIAQAEADAPKTDDAVDQRLKGHSL